MRSWCLIICILMVVINFVMGKDACSSKENCNDCIKHINCVFCKKNDTQIGQRCKSTKDHNYSAWKKNCEQENVIEYDNSREIIEDKDFSNEEKEDIIQMKPQKINIKLKVGDPYNITLKYRHARNYPADLYYLMDSSQSMKDDKDTLSTLGESLKEAMTNITTNFRLGFGVFVDKPILPYVSTVPIDKSKCGDSCSTPFGFMNILALTAEVEGFKEKVLNAPMATSKDYPEGGLDALMQCMVCLNEINWRDIGVRLIVLSTDAGFHHAGDGLLGGVVTPNDMKCHLDSNGSYTHYAEFDYPSVAQINSVSKEKGFNLIFAIFPANKPIYDRLSSRIEGSKVGILESGSSNIVNLLTAVVKDIISTIKLTNIGRKDVSIRYFSKCKGDNETETAECKNLEPHDEVEFKLELKLEKCPENDKYQDTIKIHLLGRQEVVSLNVTMHCNCTCSSVGDKGFRQKAAECKEHGDYACGVCVCYDGFAGNHCECNEKETQGSDISKENCIEGNSSKACNGRGNCICGECKCNPGDSPEKKIYGQYCQCTNWEGCTGSNGLKCSDHGDCVCNECNCHTGWTGVHCSCHNSTDNCISRDTDLICAGKGTCECNTCKCEDGYSGKFCDDCTGPNCEDKCDEYRSCVECIAFQNGRYSAELCESSCTMFNVTKVPEPKSERPSEKLCSFFDEDDCSYIFVYSREIDGMVEVRVVEKPTCSEPVNMWAVVFGILGSVVLIGLLTLLIWRIFATVKDRRDYERFKTEAALVKFNKNDNPLYKHPTTHVTNPLFGWKEA